MDTKKDTLQLSTSLLLLLGLITLCAPSSIFILTSITYNYFVLFVLSSLFHTHVDNNYCITLSGYTSLLAYCYLCIEKIMHTIVSYEVRIMLQSAKLG